MSRWFRMYDDLVDDPKVQKLPLVLFKAWVNLLCIASKNDGVLPSVDDLAFSLRQDAETVRGWLNDLANKGLVDEIDGEIKPHNWDKRQFKSDRDETAVDRKRRHRERTRDTQPDVTRDTSEPVTRDTPEDVTRTEQSRAEQNIAEQSRADAPLAQDPKHWQEVQGYIKDRTDDLTDWEIDFLHSIKWAESLSKPQSDSLKTIRGKMQSTAGSGQVVFVVKAGTPEFAAWIAHDRAKGLKTTFKENLREMTVPSLFPPEMEKAA